MSTRQEILEHLAKNVYASAEDLAQILAKTRANIQYHLQQLERTGLITPVFPRASTSKRGRPRRYFGLSQTQRPHNLAILAGVLLEYLQFSPAAPQVQTDLLADIGQKIIDLPGSASAGTARLNRLVRELSNRGYQARWEAHASGPEIVFRNCPYAALLPAHPELCQMDTLILERQLGQSMIQKTRIQLPSVSACRFSNRAAGG